LRGAHGRGPGRVVPMPTALAEEIRSFQVRLGGIGEASSASSFGSWKRRAGLERLKGGVWQPYRRKWATERKDRPIVDVKAAGGWRDTNTLLTCYQHTDEESMLRVMEAPEKLRSLAAGGS
jgi:hypothetical protein